MFFPIENDTVGKMIPDNFQRLASKCGFASVLLTNCDYLFEPQSHLGSKFSKTQLYASFIYLGTYFTDFNFRN